MDYLLLTSSSPVMLENDVKKKLSQKWELQGGIAICPLGGTTGGFQYAQAMIKRMAKMP